MRVVLLSLISFSAYALDELATVEVIAGTNYQVQQELQPTQFSKSIHLQETSPGMTSPYLGAFTGNQVDQSINGIRMNNALFRTGPNQYFSWVPTNFVSSVSVSDGGNVGGTISRDLSVATTHIGSSFNSANMNFTEFGSYKTDKFGIQFNNINTGNVNTASDTVPNSDYNQVALLAEAKWSNSQKTTLMYSNSQDLPRTDKWNGGIRSTGIQKSSPYTYQLQSFAFLNHKISLDNWSINLAYQNSLENILDKDHIVQSNLSEYTANISYWINNAVSLYSTNSIENIHYDNGIVAEAKDLYATTKQGIRYGDSLLGLEVIGSVGFKEVNVTDHKMFFSSEGSVIIGKNGFFSSFDFSTNAPSYFSLRQSLTTGRGQSLPNPNLQQERAATTRIGYKKYGFYIDGYYKHFDNVITQSTVAKDTYKPENYGHEDVLGTTFAYTNRSVFDSGIGFDGRVEFTHGEQSVYKKDYTEPTSKTIQAVSYVKVDYSNVFVEWQYAPKDDAQSVADLDDIRIFEHNTGYNVFNVGYYNQYKNLEYTVAMQNVFNDNGRVLGSSVNQLGRGAYVNVKYNF